jgi:hypothetical protein
VNKLEIIFKERGDMADEKPSRLVMDTSVNIPQHVRHDEEPHVATPNINLVEVRDTAIASCDGDILELNVHVVLGCAETENVSE